MGCFTFCKKKDGAIIVAGAGGVGALANGRYKQIGLHGGLPKFKQVNGCSIIFFSTFWKINVQDDTSGWYYEAPDGIWKAAFPAAQPPPSVPCWADVNLNAKSNVSDSQDKTSENDRLIQELQQENERLQKLLEGHSTISNDLQTEVSQLRAKVQTAEAYRETLRVEQQSTEGLRKQIAELQRERQSFQTMRQEMTQMKSEKQTFFDDLAAQIAELKSENLILKDSLVKACEEIAVWEQRSGLMNAWNYKNNQVLVQTKR